MSAPAVFCPCVSGSTKSRFAISAAEASEEHWKQYGPGAGGVGWDLTFLGLALHLDSGGQAIDAKNTDAWLASDAGKAFMRNSADDWREAHVKAGEDPEVAEAMARRTADFYTGA